MLIDFENVIVSPHNAFDTIEAKKRILDTSINNIKDFLENKESENRVV